ncbi:MAG: sulfatase [Planctomycetaceae bacterium]
MLATQIHLASNASLTEIPIKLGLLRLACLATLLSAWSLSAVANAAEAVRRPNFVVIFADDLGYGDLSCYGHPTIRTPNLDRMAGEGVRFTQFYAAAEVCTPSRAGLLTGRLPPRNGMCSDKRRVLFHDSTLGLAQSEITIAEVLKPLGYATACYGKWHLGHQPDFLPTTQGFDTYFGIPYSNDMDRLKDLGGLNWREATFHPQMQFWNVPLMRDTEIVERPADQNTVTRRYTEEAVKFISDHKAQPFFVYLPHNMPHVPLFRSSQFENHSRRGLFGDVIEEIDWSVGQVLDTLQAEGLAENTLVWFTSDNGPWLIWGDHGGSAGLLKDGKGCTWEGGMREPSIAWWPGKISGGRVCPELASTLDFLPTFAALSGGQLPTDRTLDGYDLSPLLLENKPSPRETMYYYRGPRLMAVRHGAWKAHFITQTGYGPEGKTPTPHDPPLLYNLEHDPSEREDVAKQHPDVLRKIAAIVAEHQAGMEIIPSRLDEPQPNQK